jgi:hypothetical protein
VGCKFCDKISVGETKVVTMKKKMSPLKIKNCTCDLKETNKKTITT